MNENILKSTSRIPKAPYYVLVRDKFLSGWGAAKGTSSWLIFLCSTHEEVQAVTGNCKHRDDFERVRICDTPPSISGKAIYHLATKKDYIAFYQPNYFKNRAIGRGV